MNNGILNITIGVVMVIIAGIRIHNDEIPHAIIDIVLASMNIIVGYLLYLFQQTY